MKISWHLSLLALWGSLLMSCSGGYEASSSSLAAAAAQPSFLYKIEASQYSNMLGVITGPASDIDGGTSVGSIDADDWMTYKDIFIPKTGQYTMAFRVASPYGGRLQFEEAGGGKIYGTMPFRATGGWNTWNTIYTSFHLPAGQHTFAIKALQGGWNFHWFSIVKEIGSTDSANSSWRLARLTHYNSYPDPGSSECTQYNGCQWAGMFAALQGRQSREWVASNNIASVHSEDFEKYKLKTLRLKKNGKSLDVKVYDMCSDSDCNGCCTRNKREKGFLIDLEMHTANRFGEHDGDVEWSCLDCN